MQGGQNGSPSKTAVTLKPLSAQSVREDDKRPATRLAAFFTVLREAPRSRLQGILSCCPNRRFYTESERADETRG